MQRERHPHRPADAPGPLPDEEYDATRVRLQAMIDADDHQLDTITPLEAEQYLQDAAQTNAQ